MRISDLSSDVCSSDLYNAAAVELSGREPTLGHDKWCTTWRLHSTNGAPLPHDECPMAVALKEQRPVTGEEAIAERPDGSRVRFAAYPTPLFDAEGQLSGAVNMLLDVSARHTAEIQAAHLAAVVASRSEEHTSELQSLMRISYAVFCLKKKK